MTNKETKQDSLEPPDMDSWVQIAVSEDQASSYDSYEERFHGTKGEEMRDTLVDCLEIDSSSDVRVLDCGTGTADMALRVANRFPNAQVLAIDASDIYLSVADRKIKQQGLDKRVELKNVNFQNGLPEELGKFDYVVSQYVFHYRFDLDVLFQSIYSSLNPPGKLAFGIDIEPDDMDELDRWWKVREENSYNWYRARGLSSEEALERVREDRRFLERCGEDICVDRPLDEWLTYLQQAGFAGAECVWKDSIDVVIRAIRP